MYKDEVVAKISEKTNFTKKDTRLFVQAMCEVIQEQVSNGEEINLIGFGKIRKTFRKSRTNTDFKGNQITCPAYHTAVFTPGAAFKKMLNPPPEKKKRGRPRKNP